MHRLVGPAHRVGELPALRERGAAGAATPARGAREEGQLLGEEAEEEGDE
jgi:hypothetical protein